MTMNEVPPLQRPPFHPNLLKSLVLKGAFGWILDVDKITDWSSCSKFRE